MKEYRGHTDAQGDVHVDRVENGSRSELPLHLDLRNHSPTGFNYGYAGSGPAQLALALLADYLGDDETAQQHYQDFKFKVIARLPQGEPFTITGAQIEAALADITRARGRSR
jgi:Family of unknown function (DUF6166)